MLASIKMPLLLMLDEFCPLGLAPGKIRFRQLAPQALDVPSGALDPVFEVGFPVIEPAGPGGHRLINLEAKPIYLPAGEFKTPLCLHLNRRQRPMEHVELLEHPR